MIQLPSAEGFEVLDEGTYPAKVENTENTTSKAGNPMVKVKLDINGVTVFDQIAITDKSLFRVRQVTDAIGLTKPGQKSASLNVDTLEELSSLLTGAMEGQSVTVSIVVDDSYDGKPRNKVDKYHPKQGIGLPLD